MFVSEIIKEIQEMTDEDVHELIAAALLQLKDRREDARETGQQCIERVDYINELINDLLGVDIKAVDESDDELEIGQDDESLDSQSQVIRDFLCTYGPMSPAGVAAALDLSVQMVGNRLNNVLRPAGLVSKGSDGKWRVAK